VNRINGWPPEIENAVKDSFVGARIFQQPQPLVANVRGRVSEGNINRMKGKVQNNIGRLEDTSGKE
jgi:hypothetical protein